MECRNCGATEVILADNALLAPFFAKRVHGLEPVTLERYIEQKLQLSQAPSAKLAEKMLFAIKHIPVAKSLVRHRMLFAQARTRTCRRCGFVGPDLEYSSEMLQNLYLDYRSDSYNNERCCYEPSYRKIKSFVGKEEIEVKARQNNMAAIISDRIDMGVINNVLDWGGGNGRFVPDILSQKEVSILDISNEPIEAGYSRISRIEKGMKFDYVQVCHVLEHVGNPKKLLNEIVTHLRPGGYIYLEVPKDRSDADLRKFQECSASVSHLLHEHINLFCADSLESLSLAAGLKKLDVREAELDIGWSKVCVICGLFQSVGTLPKSHIAAPAGH